MASTVGVGVWLVELSVAESVNISQRGQAQGEGKDEEREAAASRGQIYIWYKVLQSAHGNWNIFLYYMYSRNFLLQLYHILQSTGF